MHPITGPLFGALCFLLAYAAPVAAQPEAPAQPEGPISAPHNPSTDNAIAKRLRTILDELDGYDAVEVAVESGVVTLTGETRDNIARPSRADRDPDRRGRGHQ